MYVKFVPISGKQLTKESHYIVCVMHRSNQVQKTLLFRKKITKKASYISIAYAYIERDGGAVGEGERKIEGNSLNKIFATWD